MSGIGARLVDALFWRSRGLHHRAFIRVRDGRFYFEGRVRLPDGTHEYFPREEWYANDIGTVEKAKAAVDGLLSGHGCPSAQAAEALGKMDACP